ncbi:alpha/beta fold hydrolase [Thalassomonas viridans]|uniref:Alpha/beta fold hydrolase n=1 Tax=Thalassomonas viridans TaxID=137584 RepID=A0AAF0C8M8_9GAMM|nr:alpha/beta fold hydrolase [Thalassomonas viridans]WDE04350.1 alpha/beta fold hydrolase [Thalassomonas viridans]
MTARFFIYFLIFLLPACSFNSVFFPIDERPDDVVDVNIERVELVSSDGKRIQHYFFKTDSPIKATIFVFQGSGSKVLNWFKVVKPLVEDGYQVFMMEYRGFGASEGDARHDSVANDANTALLYLAGRTDVEAKPLLVLGQSYGGQLAIYVTHKNQHLVDGLITEGTYTSFSEEAASFSPWPISSLVNLIVSNEYESLELIRDIRTSKLFIHSKEDKVVPFDMTQKLYSKAIGQKELWVINGRHVAGLLDKPVEYVSKVNELLNKTYN